jgi:hypothetical protein
VAVDTGDRGPNVSRLQDHPAFEGERRRVWEPAVRLGVAGDRKIPWDSCSGQVVLVEHPSDFSVALEAAQRLGQQLLGDAIERSADLGKAPGLLL